MEMLKKSNCALCSSLKFLQQILEADVEMSLLFFNITGTQGDNPHKNVYVNPAPCTPPPPNHL